MTRLSRRHFIGSAVGLGVLGAIGGKRAWDFQQKSATSAGTDDFFYDVSVQSLFCSSTKAFQSEIHHQGNTVDAAARLLREYESRMTLAFFSPEGKELHRLGSVVGPLASRRVEIPQDLGWVSVIAVQAIEARSGLSPNIEVGQFMTTNYQQQKDSHHGVLWRPRSTAYHVLRAPERGDGVLLGLTNPMGTASGAELQVFDGNGQKVHSRSLKVNACASHYFVMGDVPEAPENSEVLKLASGNTFLLRIETEVGAAFPMNSWWFGKDGGFTTSHGSYTMAADGADREVLRERVFADVVTLGADAAFKMTEASHVVIPNLSDKDLSFAFTLTQASGHVIQGHRKIKAHSAWDWDLSELKAESDGTDGLATLKIETSQPYFPAALVKIWNYSGQVLSLQHGRPDDQVYLNASQELTQRSLGGLASENWISNGPWAPARSAQLMIYNMEAAASITARVQGLGPEGIVHDVEFTQIAAQGFASLSLKDLQIPPQVEALRIFTSDGVLRASLHEFQNSGLSQSVHATSKLKFPGLLRRPPPLIDRRSNDQRSYARESLQSDFEFSATKPAVDRRRDPRGV